MPRGILLGAQRASLGRTVLLPVLVRDALCVRSGEGSEDELPLDASMAPRLRSELNDLAHAGEKTIQLLGVSEVFDVVDDFVDDHGGDDVDGLLSV